VKFPAYRIFEEGGGVSARFVEMSLDELSPGDLVIRAAYSSVNYKDALAATGAGKVVRKFPTVGGIDVAGIVERSSDARFKKGDPVLVTGFELGVSHDGGFASFVRVPGDWVVPVPPGLTLFDCMAIGTAGFTAALSVVEMERNGLTPSRGPVIVTGATGGVGSLAIACLAARGYRVTALTRKDAEHEYLRSLGAADVIASRTLQMGTRPLEKATWAGAVDAVGGDVLAWLTRTMAVGGTIASTGLTGGAELHTTVMPFILRGVKLLGIDSVGCAMETRREVWQRLGGDLKPATLATIAREVPFAALPGAFPPLLAGLARGRTVVRIEGENP
jgi:NADPH2:quinone reductase